MKNLFILALVLCSFSANAQLSSGMVAWWPFNGNAGDSSGNAHISTPYNITYGTGMHGLPNTAAVFNGHNSYVGVSYKSDLNLTKFSICAKIKAMAFYDSLCQTNMIVCRGKQTFSSSYALHFFDNAYDNDSCAKRDTTKNVFGGWAGSYSGSSSQFQYTPTIQLNTWYTVVMTYENDTMRFYVNGVKKSTYKGSGPITTSTDSLHIGANYRTYIGYSYWFNGYMDDLRIYDRVLADSDITTYSLDVQDVTATIEDVQLYPNPATDRVMLKGSVRTLAQVQLCMTNNVGQVVHSATVQPAQGMIEQSIDISGLNKGFYFVRLVSGTESMTKKLVVQ